MILILGKAAGCSWMTTKELLLMQAAGRNMTPDDLERALERYKKLSQQTARNIIKFREQRKKVHARSPNDESAGKRDAGASSATAMDDAEPAKPAASRPATASA